MIHGPSTVIVHEDEDLVEYIVIRAKRVRMNGIWTFECLVEKNGELAYVYASC